MIVTINISTQMSLLPLDLLYFLRLTHFVIGFFT
jgi:hypothetical protein